VGIVFFAFFLKNLPSNLGDEPLIYTFMYNKDGNMDTVVYTSYSYCFSNCF